MERDVGWQTQTMEYRQHMLASLIHHRLTWKRLAGLCLLGLIAAGIIIWTSDRWVESTAAKYCHATVGQAPVMPAGLVLGCAPFVGSRTNYFFEHRMDTAAELYRSGKVKALIVSGDNSTKEYDEPTAMKEALVKRGVPEQAIYSDYAGFRTLDSVVRADTIFGQKRFIIVSQRFHNERAVFLARQRGLEAEAVNARDVDTPSAQKTYLREYLARVQAVLDVTVLQTRPKFDGPPVIITQP
jgi:SanA protein